MVLESYVAELLTSYVGQYCCNINADQLKLSISQGSARLEDLTLDTVALNRLDLPIEILGGSIGMIELTVPWRAWTHPSSLKIRGVHLLCGPLRLSLEERALRRKQRLLNQLAPDVKPADSKATGDAHNTSGEQPAAGEDKSSFAERLARSILSQLKVSIEDVSLRYEDATSKPEAPFACGVVIEGLSVEGGQAMAAGEALPDLIRRVVKLQNAHIYWDAHADNLFVPRPRPTTAAETAVASREAADHATSRPRDTQAHRLMNPLTAEMEVTLRRSLEPSETTGTLNVLLTVSDGLRGRLNEGQYRSAMDAAAVLIASARLDDLHRREVEMAEEKSKDVQADEHQREAYTLALNTRAALKPGQQLSVHTVNLLNLLEQQLPVRTLVAIRLAARHKREREARHAAAAAKQSGIGGWISSFWGSAPEVPSSPVGSSADEEALLNELFELAHASDAATAAGAAGSSINGIRYRAVLRVPLVTFELVASERPLLSLTAGTMELSMTQRIYSSDVVITMGGMAIADVYTVGTRLPVVAALGEPANPEATSHLRVETFSQDFLPPEFSHGHDLHNRIALHLQPLAVVAPAPLVARISAFFRVRHSALRNRLVKAYNARITELGRIPIDAYVAHRRIGVAMATGPILLLAPLDVAAPSTPIISARLETILVKSGETEDASTTPGVDDGLPGGLAALQTTDDATQTEARQFRVVSQYTGEAAGFATHLSHHDKPRTKDIVKATHELHAFAPGPNALPLALPSSRTSSSLRVVVADCARSDAEGAIHSCTQMVGSLPPLTINASTAAANLTTDIARAWHVTHKPVAVSRATTAASTASSKASAGAQPSSTASASGLDDSGMTSSDEDEAADEEAYASAEEEYLRDEDIPLATPTAAANTTTNDGGITDMPTIPRLFFICATVGQMDVIGSTDAGPLATITMGTVGLAVRATPREMALRLRLHDLNVTDTRKEAATSCYKAIIHGQPATDLFDLRLGVKHAGLFGTMEDDASPRAVSLDMRMGSLTVVYLPELLVASVAWTRALKPLAVETGAAKTTTPIKSTLIKQASLSEVKRSPERADGTPSTPRNVSIVVPTTPATPRSVSAPVLHTPTGGPTSTPLPAVPPAPTAQRATNVTINAVLGAPVVVLPTRTNSPAALLLEFGELRITDGAIALNPSALAPAPSHTVDLHAEVVHVTLQTTEDGVARDALLNPFAVAMDANVRLGPVVNSGGSGGSGSPAPVRVGSVAPADKQGEMTVNVVFPRVMFDLKRKQVPLLAEVARHMATSTDVRSSPAMRTAPATAVPGGATPPTPSVNAAGAPAPPTITVPAPSSSPAVEVPTTTATATVEPPPSPQPPLTPLTPAAGAGGATTNIDWRMRFGAHVAAFQMAIEMTATDTMVGTWENFETKWSYDGQTKLRVGLGALSLIHFSEREPIQILAPRVVASETIPPEAADLNQSVVSIGDGLPAEYGEGQTMLLLVTEAVTIKDGHHLHEWTLRLRLQPLDVVFSTHLLDSVGHLLSSPNVRQLMLHLNAMSSRPTAWVAENVAAVTTSRHTWRLHVDVKAPLVIVPTDPHNLDAVTLALDLGQLRLRPIDERTYAVTLSDTQLLVAAARSQIEFWRTSATAASDGPMHVLRQLDVALAMRSGTTKEGGAHWDVTSIDDRPANVQIWLADWQVPLLYTVTEAVEKARETLERRARRGLQGLSDSMGPEQLEATLNAMATAPPLAPTGPPSLFTCAVQFQCLRFGVMLRQPNAALGDSMIASAALHNMAFTWKDDGSKKAATLAIGSLRLFDWLNDVEMTMSDAVEEEQLVHPADADAAAITLTLDYTVINYIPQVDVNLNTKTRQHWCLHPVTLVSLLTFKDRAFAAATPPQPATPATPSIPLPAEGTPRVEGRDMPGTPAATAATPDTPGTPVITPLAMAVRFSVSFRQFVITLLSGDSNYGDSPLARISLRRGTLDYAHVQAGLWSAKLSLGRVTVEDLTATLHPVCVLQTQLERGEQDTMTIYSSAAGNLPLEQLHQRRQFTETVLRPGEHSDPTNAQHHVLIDIVAARSQMVIFPRFTTAMVDYAARFGQLFDAAAATGSYLAASVLAAPEGGSSANRRVGLSLSAVSPLLVFPRSPNDNLSPLIVMDLGHVELRRTMNRDVVYEIALFSTQGIFAQEKDDLEVWQSALIAAAGGSATSRLHWLAPVSAHLRIDFFGGRNQSYEAQNSYAAILEFAGPLNLTLSEPVLRALTSVYWAPYLTSTINPPAAPAPRRIAYLSRDHIVDATKELYRGVTWSMLSNTRIRIPNGISLVCLDGTKHSARNYMMHITLSDVTMVFTGYIGKGPSRRVRYERQASTVRFMRVQFDNCLGVQYPVLLSAAVEEDQQAEEPVLYINSNIYYATPLAEEQVLGHPIEHDVEEGADPEVVAHMRAIDEAVAKQAAIAYELAEALQDVMVIANLKVVVHQLQMHYLESAFNDIYERFERCIRGPLMTLWYGVEVDPNAQPRQLYFKSFAVTPIRANVTLEKFIMSFFSMNDAEMELPAVDERNAIFLDYQFSEYLTHLYWSRDVGDSLLTHFGSIAGGLVKSTVGVRHEHHPRPMPSLITKFEKRSAPDAWRYERNVQKRREEAGNNDASAMRRVPSVTSMPRRAEEGWQIISQEAQPASAAARQGSISRAVSKGTSAVSKGTSAVAKGTTAAAQGAMRGVAKTAGAMAGFAKRIGGK